MGPTGPAVLARKQAGVNGIQGAVKIHTVFAIIKDLRNVGLMVKSLMSTGYGGDLVTGGSGQGVYFLTSFQLVEIYTQATKRIQYGSPKRRMTALPPT
jgi:hypothetical protein